MAKSQADEQERVKNVNKVSYKAGFAGIALCRQLI